MPWDGAQLHERGQQARGPRCASPCPESLVSLAVGHPGRRLPRPSVGERQRELSITSQRTLSGAPVLAGGPRWVVCQPRGSHEPWGRKCPKAPLAGAAQGLYLCCANYSQGKKTTIYSNSNDAHSVGPREAEWMPDVTQHSGGLGQQAAPRVHRPRGAGGWRLELPFRGPEPTAHPHLAQALKAEPWTQGHGPPSVAGTGSPRRGQLCAHPAWKGTLAERLVVTAPGGGVRTSCATVGVTWPPRKVSSFADQFL